jgi:sulfur-oxidizing protein SoxZ
MASTLITKNSIRFRLQKQADDSQEFKALLSHPMETGTRRDFRTNQLIPADYIDTLRIMVDGIECFAITLGANVSKNPFLAFVFSKPVHDNQVLRIEWTDNDAQVVFYEIDIVFDATGKFSFQSDAKATVIPQLLPEAGPACATPHGNPQQ